MCNQDESTCESSEQSSLSKGGKMASVFCSVCVSPASFHGGWLLLCVLLLPLVAGASLQCGPLHSRQSVCRGCFSAVHSSSSRLHLTKPYPLALHQLTPRLCRRGNSSLTLPCPTLFLVWKYELTCSGNTPFFTMICNFGFARWNLANASYLKWN